MASETREETRAFNAGYLIAVANIVHTHDETVVAEDVLSALGISRSTMERIDLTDYDKTVLRKLFRENERKADLARRRSLSRHQVGLEKGGERG